MSVRENLEIFTDLDIAQYLQILEEEYQARQLPGRLQAYVAGYLNLPFYEPKAAGDHISILGFNLTFRTTKSTISTIISGLFLN